MERAAAIAAGAALVVLALVPSCGNNTEAPPTRPDATSCNGFCIDAQAIDVPTCSDALLPCVVVTRLLQSCSGPSEPNCHGGDNPAKFFLHFNPETDLKQLVNVDSTERPDWKRVAPFDPAHSWVIAKLRDDREAGVETAMPLGSDGDPKIAALIEQWILEGAPTSLDAAAYEESDAPSDLDTDADADADIGTDAPDAGEDANSGDG